MSNGISESAVAQEPKPAIATDEEILKRACRKGAVCSYVPTCHNCRVLARISSDRAALAEKDEVIRTLMEALESDAAGGPVSTAMRLAADYLNEHGGGPLEDRLRMSADAIDAALALAKEPRS